MKDALIAQIEAIYRDIGHARRGKPLSAFSEGQLRRHLEGLTAGIEWVKRDKIPPQPPFGKGGERRAKWGDRAKIRAAPELQTRTSRTEFPPKVGWPTLKSPPAPLW